MNMHVMCVRSAGLRGRGHMCPAAQQDGLSLSFPLPDPPLCKHCHHRSNQHLLLSSLLFLNSEEEPKIMVARRSLREP